MVTMRSLTERYKKMPLAVKIAVIVILLAGPAWVLGRGILMPDKKETTPVSAVKADNRVIAEGVVLPEKYVNLALASDGVVAEILVKEGDLVAEGQILARLENSELRAELDNARAELAKAAASFAQTAAGTASRDIQLKEAQQEEAQAEYEQSSADYKRYQLLYEQGGISQQELERARAASVKAEARLKQARVELDIARVQGPEDLAAAQAEVKVISARLAQSELRAPFAGTIAAINLGVGEAIPACTPLIYLADCSAWQIKTEDLSELDIARVKKGAPASISFDAVPELVLPARVVQIRALGEKKRGDMTYTVTLKPEKQDSRLYWNMTALVKIGEPGNSRD